MSFKSGKFNNLTYDQIINNGGETLNNLINSKHVAYKKFNEYYQQKKSIQEFTIKRKKNIVKRALKNFINNLWAIISTFEYIELFTIGI